MTRGPGRTLRLAGIGAAAFLLLPTVFVVPLSLSASSVLEFPPDGLSTRWYGNFFQDRDWTSATMTSLTVGLAVAALATVLGTIAALGLDRLEIRGKTALRVLFLGPMLVPVVVVAVGTYATFARWHLAGTFQGLVIGHTVLALPFVVVTVAAGVQSLDRTLERAAQTLGASPLQTFRRLTLPMLAPSIGVGALFAFMTSWDEIVVSIFLSSPLTRTLPIVTFAQLRTSLDPTIAAVATMLTLLTVLLMVATVLIERRATRRRA
jgi:putative spermidine/putrescine transport system permease protein